MSDDPRVVFGMPAYNRPDTLAHTLESLLMQSERDFALLVCDDAPSTETRAIVARYAAVDTRVHYEENRQRLGMVANWRRCCARASALFPGSRFFAWVSDHDFWHPRWLEALLPVLVEHPRVVLAYPRSLRSSAGAKPRVPHPFETVGIKDPIVRVRRVADAIVAGDAIYGLFRRSALERAGVFRPVLLPDRQLLLALAALGEFRQLPEVLWYRDSSRRFSHARQREAFFAGRPPLYSYFPPHLQHAALLVWDFTLRGVGGGEVGRVAGLRAAAAYLRASRQRTQRQEQHGR